MLRNIHIKEGKRGQFITLMMKDLSSLCCERSAIPSNDVKAAKTCIINKRSMSGVEKPN